MRIETNEETCFIAVVCTLIICVALLAFGGCRQVEQTKREAIKAGAVPLTIQTNTIITINPLL